MDKKDGVLWHPHCVCSMTALEPSDDCYIHGCPDVRKCPNCGQFRGYKPCKRCGCDYGIREITQAEEE